MKVAMCLVPKDVDNGAKTKCMKPEVNLRQDSPNYTAYIRRKKKNSKKLLKVDSTLKLL